MKISVLVAGFLAGSSVAALAQTTVVPGGLELSLGLSQRLEFDDNLSLAPTSAGNAYQSTTRLTFALKSETPNDRIGITASTVVRGAGGPGLPNRGITVDDPRFDLTYGHTAGNGGYTLAANYRRTDLQFLRPLTDFLDANGNLVLPADLADLFGTGFRTDYGVNGSLSFGAQAPFGVTVSLGLSGLDYEKVTNGALTDSVNRTLGTNFQLRLNDVTDARVNLGFDQFENLATKTKSNSRSLDLGLTRTLANGTVGVTATARNSGIGTRVSVGITRAMALPSGSLSFGLGTTRLAGVAPSVTGSLNWSYQMPSSSVSAQFNRAISYSSANNEVLQTSFSLGYNLGVNARSSVAVNLSYSLSDPSGLLNDTSNTSLSASYALAVTPDWNMTVGYTRTMRDRDVVGKSDSNMLYLGLGRSFNIRP